MKLFRQISVQDRLPKIHKWYTVFLEGSNDHFYMEWYQDHWNDDGHEIKNVTHWLEEFELPTEDEIRISNPYHIYESKLCFISGGYWLRDLILNEK